MNLRTVDLNLLVVLDALLDEAHVTRAADRLAMSQSAASAALARARDLFNDPLLERGRDEMRLTPLAQQLRVPLKAVLTEIGALIDSPDAPVSEIHQTLRITMADYPALYILPALLQELQRAAPGIDIVVQPWSGNVPTREMLVSGRSDLAITVLPDSQDEALHCEKLLDEHYMVAMRADHPASRGFNLESWLRYPHIAVSGNGVRKTQVDDELQRYGYSRRIGLVVPGFQMAVTLLAQTDYLALVPSRALAHDSGLITFPPPLPISGFPIHLAWHTRRAQDRGLRYVASLIASLVN